MAGNEVSMQPKRRTTIVRQHLIRLLLAMAAGLLAFLILDYGTEFFMDRYLEHSGYYDAHEKAYLQSLQEYVTQYQLSSSDSEELSVWGKKQDDLFFQIYDDNEMLFQYYSQDSRSFREAVSLKYLEWIPSYDVQFADGSYQVMFFGGYYYKAFKYLMVVSFLGAFAVFLAVFLPAIRRRTRYITRLRDEIEILGSGDLDYEVTIRGNDELTDLAENLDQMRQALRHHMEEEIRLTEERQMIVTRLSHDIRTPLTSMNLFADLLKRGDYQTDAQRDHYIDRIQENAANLTNLAEELYRAAKDSAKTMNESAADGPEDTAPEDVAGPEIVGLLADAAEALRLAGFTVQEYYAAAELVVTMSRGDFARVLDNITSNIMRYADPAGAIRFSCDKRGGLAEVEFENAVLQEEITSAGSGIGLQNVRQLMQKHGGRVEIEADEKHFRIRLALPAGA